MPPSARTMILLPSTWYGTSLPSFISFCVAGFSATGNDQELVRMRDPK